MSFKKYSTNKIYIVFLAVAAILTVVGISTMQDIKAVTTGDSESVTVVLNKQTIKPGEVLVLLDTTDSGTFNTVHVAANLPCKPGPKTGVADEPQLHIVAGVAGGTLTHVIGDMDDGDDTGFEGPEKTCIFHDTLTSAGMTDVIMQNMGTKPVTLPQNTVITITITYE